MLKLRYLASVLVVMLIWQCRPGEGAEEVERAPRSLIENRSVDEGLRQKSPSHTAHARHLYKSVLFVTNRVVNKQEEQDARREGRPERYESIFLSALNTSPTYGWAMIEYPANRKRGERDVIKYANFVQILLSTTSEPPRFESLSGSTFSHYHRRYAGHHYVGAAYPLPAVETH
jgi:hypothetical protein